MIFYLWGKIRLDKILPWGNFRLFSPNSGGHFGPGSPLRLNLVHLVNRVYGVGSGLVTDQGLVNEPLNCFT